MLGDLTILLRLYEHRGLATTVWRPSSHNFVNVVTKALLPVALNLLMHTNTWTIYTKTLSNVDDNGKYEEKLQRTCSFAFVSFYKMCLILGLSSEHVYSCGAVQGFIVPGRRPRFNMMN